MASNRPLRSTVFIVLLHTSVWAILFILPLLFEKNEPRPLVNIRHDAGRPYDFQLVSTLMNFSFIPLFYFNAEVMVPKFFNRKRWYTYAILTVVFLLLLGVLNSAARSVILHHNPFPPFIRIFALLSVFTLVTSTAYSLIRRNIKTERIRKEQEAENLKTELSFLRSQVSPHFLFNTLNNLVSLARKKSDLLEPSLLKLSGLLQYMLYESDQEKISIHKEAEYLDNYIDLQTLRFGQGVKVHYEKDIPASSSLEVVPMILIPFVENAFKHGVVFIQEPEISIRLSLSGNVLSFQVTNTYKSEQEEKDKSSGIGLANVKRRLDLLYPACKFSITTTNNVHRVNLSIPL